jgi:hypothetical protein
MFYISILAEANRAPFARRARGTVQNKQYSAVYVSRARRRAGAEGQDALLRFVRLGPPCEHVGQGEPEVPHDKNVLNF